MNRRIVLLFALLVIVIFATSPSTRGVQADASMTAFWDKFKAAVINKDKTTVANLTQFPLGMPYMVKEVRNRAQLLRRYNEIFNGEADAAKCFQTAKLATEPAQPRNFYVTCPMKDGGPEEPIVFYFTRTRTSWKFDSLDNVNE